MRILVLGVAMNASQLLKQERADAVALLESLTEDQWQTSTLCEGWNVTDLLAHMVARESQPIRFILAESTKGKLGVHPDELMRQARKQGRFKLLQEFRNGPPLAFRLPGIALANFIEQWVHNEDLRRAGLNKPRISSPAVQNLIWKMLHINARMMLRSFKTPGIISLVRPDGRALAFQVGGAFPRQANPAEATVKVIGEPGEMLLYLFGRKTAAHVTIEGDQRLAQALRNTTMGL
ncbi:maleylpyruvate isomerase family mycothiol-dependent enzyme [Herpetosiphon llansteffanensis]